MEDRENLIHKFSSLFKGETEKYTAHIPPFEVKNNGKVRAQRMYYPYADPKHKELGHAELTFQQYVDHINGKQGLAVEPLLKEGDADVCYYSVIDIDVYNDKHYPFTELITRLYDLGYSFTPVTSKSGGLHIYFFYAIPPLASRAIEAIEKIVQIMGLRGIYKNKSGGNAVEVFPMHNRVIDGRDGKCLYLPYFNAFGRPDTIGRGSLINSKGRKIPFEKALDRMIQSITTIEDVEKTTASLPYSDAPFCIQSFALSGALRSGAGRNNYLFSAAIYLKNKYEKDFLDELLEIDERLLDPIQKEEGGLDEVKQIYESVVAKEYHYGCRKAPINAICNKKLCALREYSGVVRKDSRNNTVTGADSIGKVTRYLAAQPYYGWEIAAPGKEPVEVMFKDITELSTQKSVQCKCWDVLGWAHTPVAASIWTRIVNSSMEGIEDRQVVVDSDSDTSELNELTLLLVNYLTRRSVTKERGYMIGIGSPVFADGGYYFTTKGFTEFLRVSGFKYGKINLRDRMISHGCEFTSFEYSMRDSQKSLSCWFLKQDERLTREALLYAETKDAARMDAGRILDDLKKAAEDLEEDESF